MLKKLTAAGAVAVAATGIMLAAAPANAGVTTNHSGGIISGNNVIVPITVPVDVCGNAVSVLGIAGSAGCRGGASVTGPSYHRHYWHYWRYHHRHCRHHRYPWSS